MIKRLAKLGILFLLGLLGGVASAQYATLTGALSSSNGMPAQNYIMSFTPSQMGFVGGTAVIVNTATYCATSSDGSVVGVPNPLQAPGVTTGFTGTLAPANYYVKIGFYDASGNLTLVSPETVIQLTSTGRLIVASPSSGMPSGAVGMKVYISASTNAETLQGSTTGSAAFIQSIPLVSGTAVPTTNTTLCKQIANDVIWPTGTGYTVALTDPSGNTVPGYPMQWQLMGANTTINLSNGLPYYHGTVYFPTPILASPLNHQLQSISGPVSFAGYNLSNVGAMGFGTALPAWPIDVENGAINASGGFIFNGGAGVSTGNCLLAGSDSSHTFNVPSTCLTSLPTFFYQTVALSGTSQTQRPVLNFLAPLTVTDSTSPARTTIGVNMTGTEAKLVTAAAAGTNGHCTQWDASGGIGDSGSTCAGPSTTTTCTGTVPPWGCYRVEADGTIEEWGVSAAVPTGSAQNVVALTFPLAFTSTNNLSVVAVSDGCVDTCGGTTPKNPVGFSLVQGTLSASGVTFSFTGVTPTGGGGGTLVATIHAHWHATGFH